MLQKLALAISLLLSSFLTVLFPKTIQPQYLYPLPGSQGLNPAVTIAVRYAQAFQADALSPAWFQVAGSLSGVHSGKTILSDDGRTLLFKPDAPFVPGERVAVAINPTGTGMTGLAQVRYDFQVRAEPAQHAAAAEFEPSPSAASAPARTGLQAAPQYVTAPATLPAIQVTTAANGTAEGSIFLSNFDWYRRDDPLVDHYILILDDKGKPVYYQPVPINAVDFKKQPNGFLSYYDGKLPGFYVMNNSYQVVDIYQPGNGYAATTIDAHDLQLLPNGHALIMIFDTQVMDMSGYGGPVDAQVEGLVIQEMDQNKNVVFEWRSWDHFALTDTYVALDAPVVDYVHPNAIELDQDGNLLISSRHTAEITKINRQTGAIIWRLGGKNNQFTFVDDPYNGFYYQHDIRRLPNGTITLFDNRTALLPAFSRGVEYQLDENNKTATMTWEYLNPLGIYSLAMGNMQRLPNGNSLIAWGSGPATASITAFPNITEVKPDGSKALELSLPAGYVSYRAFRFPWHGYPTWAPALVVQNQAQTTTLYYSWNGATEIGSYKIYASTIHQPIPDQLIAAQARTGFENSTVVPAGDTTYCYFQVKAFDKLGRPTRSSEVVPNQACFQTFPSYLPLVTAP